MERTTDLEVIRRYPRRFTWGPVTAMHDVGRYSLLEFEDAEGRRAWHVYVDGKDTHRSGSTLESAMLTAIAFSKFENKNVADERARCAAVLLSMPGDSER